MAWQTGQHVHLVGVGGFGMSAIARILLQRGVHVSGSDRQLNALTSQLSILGATIFEGHRAENVTADCVAVVVTSAVPNEHIEIQQARALGVPVYKRSQMIDLLMEGKMCLAVAGTHGKTTTTAMLAFVLQEANAHPSYIVGGVLANTGDNARHGDGSAFVIEADEYDNMFHGLHPHTAILTSVEYDHPDFFTTPSAMIASFEQFLSQVAGVVVGYGGDETVRHLLANRPHVFYGIEGTDGLTWQAESIHYEAEAVRFDVRYQGELLGTVRLGVFGQHNILNALATIAVATEQGIAFETIANALSHFKGTGRRFDLRADVNGIAIIDDYAHHPTAIKTTIEACRHRYPNREVWAIWQPHTFSRTLELREDYLRSFDEAHHVVITDIFASREAFTDSIHSRQLVAQLAHPSAFYGGDLGACVALLREQVHSPAVLLIMSAGDAPRIGVDFLAGLSS